MSDASGSGHAEASQDEDALPTLTLEQTMALLIQDFVHGRAQMPPPLSLPLPATIHDTATAGDVAPGVSAVSDAGASDRDSLHETEAAHTADENDHENGNQVASDNESEISIDAPAAPPVCHPCSFHLTPNCFPARVCHAVLCRLLTFSLRQPSRPPALLLASFRHCIPLPRNMQQRCS